MSLNLSHLLSGEVRTESRSPASLFCLSVSGPVAPGRKNYSTREKCPLEPRRNAPRGRVRLARTTGRALPTTHRIKNLCFSGTSWAHFFPPAGKVTLVAGMGLSPV